MWEPQPLTTLRAFKACRGENFTFYLTFYNMSVYVDMCVLCDDVFPTEEAGIAVSF
jgi:hypothetical protein